MDKMRTLVSIALVLGSLVPASAGVLYKSVDRNGRTTFSDVPVDGAVTVQRIESSESAKPAVGNDNGLVYLALADVNNEAVARANAQVDLAEHALAEARRTLVADEDPLALGSTRRSRTDLQRLDFYKRDVLEARKALMRALQQRQMLAPRPVA